MSERLEVSARKRGEHGGESYLSQRSYYVYCHAHTARTAVATSTNQCCTHPGTVRIRIVPAGKHTSSHVNLQTPP
jgi:hypothetical protein